MYYLWLNSKISFCFLSSDAQEVGGNGKKAVKSNLQRAQLFGDPSIHPPIVASSSHLDGNRLDCQAQLKISSRPDFDVDHVKRGQAGACQWSEP